VNLFELFVKIGVDDQASDKISSLSSKLGNGLKTAAKIGTAAVGAAAAGITALTTAAVNNYAEYEQLVGGVETLFKQSADVVQQYAENAYKTAGMSANEYMDTVTSFSASLLQSLDGDTAAAAEKANLAITDMSDNANKMGTSMEMIQNAYQGFAKQNYTMLDNLKLGYGGTKEEMSRLIADAAKLSDTVDAQSMSFDNIVEAIHVVQTEMGITGTTAKEAGTTIQGSVASMKSAWTNLLTGLADGNANIEQLVDNLVTTIVGDGTETNLGVLGNILPAIQTALNGASTLISEALPEIVGIIPTIINDNLHILAEAAVGIIQSLMDGISQNKEMLFDTIFGVVTYLAETFIEMLPQIVELGLDLIVSLANGISENLPEIIPTIVEIINQIMATITENLPLLISSALEIIVSLANGIAESLPELIPTIVDVVIQIVETLIDNVDMLVDAAIAIIIALAEGIINALPRLIEKAPVIIEKLVTAIVNNVPKLIKAALEIIVTLAKGLISNIPKLVKVIPQIVKSIVNGFVSLMGQITGIGKNIVNGIWQGIQSMVSWFTSKVEGFFSGIVNSVKNALGIHSPSKVFASIGGYMAEGLGEGWDDKFSDVRNEIDKSLDFDDPSMSINASVRKFGAESAGIAGTAFGGTSIGNVTINIDGSKYNDEKSLAEAIAKALQNMTDRRAAVYA
jgi:phage-related protein